jgi:iron complex transport system substrate-binding protein
MVAAVLGVEEKGEALANHVLAEFAGVRRALAGISQPRKVVFVLSLVGGRTLAAGTNTAANAIISLAGAKNVLSGYEGYKQVSDEALTGAAPEAVLAMVGGGQAISPDQVFALPAFAATPAGASRRLILMDGLYLLGFGPRTASAVRDLAAQLYPEMKIPPLAAVRAP